MSCCFLVSRYWEQSLAIFPRDRLGDVARELREPGLHSPVVIANDLPARRHPGVGADHEAVWVLHEDHPPRGIERAAVRDVGPERQLDPEFREPLEEPSDGGRRGRHAGVRPEETHLRIERQQLLDGDVVHVSLEKQVALRRQLGDTLDSRRAHVGDAQVELADAPVDPALEPLLDVGLHAGVVGPALPMSSRVRYGRRNGTTPFGAFS